MSNEYAIVNERTGEPLKNDDGNPITREGEEDAADIADFYTTGNRGDFEARPLREVTNRYLGLDLEGYAETPEETPDAYGGRTPYMKALLPDEADLRVYSTGGYQGTMGFVIGLDGYYWLIKEMFGSCSYCDGMLGASNRLDYARSILRNAYAFDDPSEARKFLTEQAEDGGYGWGRIADEMQDLLDEVEA